MDSLAPPSAKAVHYWQASMSNAISAVILAIEDDPTVRQYLNLALSSHGYEVIEAVSGQGGLAQAAARQPDLIVLDLGLPDMDGLEVTRQLRDWTRVPILVLSGKRNESDKVAALDAGADDYITKPYGTEELLARVRVALRRVEQAPPPAETASFRCGDLHIDHLHRKVYVEEIEIRLTPTEYKLLCVLAREVGRVVPHRQILKEVWGPEFVREANYLRVYVKHLRDKLEPNPSEPAYILSEPGVGYRLSAQP